MLKEFNSKNLRVVCTKEDVMDLLQLLHERGYIWADGESLDTFNPFVDEYLGEVAMSDKVLIGVWDNKFIIWGDYPMDALSSYKYVKYENFINSIQEEI